MSSDFPLRLARLMILLFCQITILNNIHIFGYITFFVIGYMVVCFHHNTSRIAILLWGFLAGLITDMFSNTAGMMASAMTLVAMVQPNVMKAFLPHDAAEEITPTLRNFGFWKYILYVFILMLTLHSAFYILDAFTLANWKLTLTAIVSGAGITSFLIVFIELAIRPRRRIS